MSISIDNVEHDTMNEHSADLTSDADGGPDSQTAEVTSNHRDEPSNEPVVAETPATGVEPVDERELQAILETLLFVSHEPLTVDRLGSVLGGVAKSEIRQALESLKSDYEKRERGLQIHEVAGGFQLNTRPEYAPWIKMLGKTKTSAKLSRSGLESLAIIAYKQPIVRGEIEAIRGVETSGVLRTLLERKLVRMWVERTYLDARLCMGRRNFFCSISACVTWLSFHHCESSKSSANLNKRCSPLEMNPFKSVRTIRSSILPMSMRRRFFLSRIRRPNNCRPDRQRPV
jgi:segregation and condensation protein B